MNLGSLFADAERDGDFLVAHPLSDQVDDLDFPGCQRWLDFADGQRGRDIGRDGTVAGVPAG